MEVNDDFFCMFQPKLCNKLDATELLSTIFVSVFVTVSLEGVNIKTDLEALKAEMPNIVVGTPGRILDLANRKALDLSKVKHFVLDECDRMLAEVSMRKDVQSIFKLTPHDKQVMMYSATLDKEVRPVCRKFCQDVSGIP